jgi:hypothetical protein
MCSLDPYNKTERIGMHICVLILVTALKVMIIWYEESERAVYESCALKIGTFLSAPVFQGLTYILSSQCKFEPLFSKLFVELILGDSKEEVWSVSSNSTGYPD